jgi:hypothetical protein
MSAVVVFDEFDAWEFYQQCIKYVEDREYCKEAAKLALAVQPGQSCAYGKKAQLHVVLPDYRRLAVAIDKERRFVVIYLDVVIRVELDAPEGGQRPNAVGGRYVIELLYEKHSDGFRLKLVDWITPEVRAMRNPHPSAFFRQQ